MTTRKFFESRIIDVDDRSELDYWVKYLETTTDELLAAISDVGASAADVKERLARKREAT